MATTTRRVVIVRSSVLKLLRGSSRASIISLNPTPAAHAASSSSRSSARSTDRTRLNPHHPRSIDAFFASFIRGAQREARFEAAASDSHRERLAMMIAAQGGITIRFALY
jgi:hypothetical protein